MDKNKVGLALGGFFAFWHLVWAILVGIGVAEGWMTWVLGLHFLDNPFTYQPFSLMGAIWLIIVTFVFGYILGWVFAYCSNWVHKKK